MENEKLLDCTILMKGISGVGEKKKILLGLQNYYSLWMFLLTNRSKII